MSDRNKVADLVERHEGRIPYVYKDSLGFDTIGVGHLVDRRKGGKLPDHIITALRDWDVAQAEEELAKALPWSQHLDDVRYAVLVDMVFNLGIEPFDHDGFKDWPRFVEQVRVGNYTAAAANLRTTQPWASQVKDRATRLADMMGTGDWPEGL
jgi:lysozyme